MEKHSQYKYVNFEVKLPAYKIHKKKGALPSASSTVQNITYTIMETQLQI
jgi:hypothetical protein